MKTDDPLGNEYLAMFGVDPFMPPEPDEMPGQPWAPHPESLRGRVIALYLETEDAWRKILAALRGSRP